LEPLLKYPAATHPAGPVQDTPLNSLCCVEELLGLGTMDQVDPFQVSISVWYVVAPR
jgi:hypothetical protein